MLNPQGGDSDAHFGLGDFGDRDDLNRAGHRSDVRSGLSGLPACVRPGNQLLRMPLHVAASVQRVGIGAPCPMRRQSILLKRRRSRRLSATSPHLLKLRFKWPPCPPSPTSRKSTSRRDPRRWRARPPVIYCSGRCPAVGHRTALHLPSLRQEGRRCPPGFRLGKSGPTRGDYGRHAPGLTIPFGPRGVAKSAVRMIRGEKPPLWCGSNHQRGYSPRW